MKLTDEDLLRYSRHILLPEIDLAGQEKLHQAKVAVIGCGGLGNIALPILAGAGIDTLFLVDFDRVDLSNLHRQTSFSMADVGQPKTTSLAHKLHGLNPNVRVELLDQQIGLNALITLCHQVDVILDCSDNFQTRKHINQAAFQTKTPLVSGSAVRFEGQLSLYDFRTPDSPCYNCLFDGETASDGACALFGVFSPVVHIIGATQAQEALKLIMGLEPLLTNQLRSYNALTGLWQSFAFTKNPQCGVCIPS